ncbi:MAG: polysaccharide biosynthesis/export family protein [Phycisphaerae bacterium]
MMNMQGILAKTWKWAVICVMICGCSQNADRVKMAQLQQFLQKDRSPVGGVEYRVLPPDVISVTSRTVQEIDSVTQQIRPDGKISLPLVGDVFVAGLTPQEIRQEITAGAQRFYTKVDITVFVSEYNSQKIYVFGEVAGPGPLPWTGSDTLLDVLSRTQPTLLAWPEKIKVIRAKKPRRGGYIPGAEESSDENVESAEITNKQGAQELTVDLMAMVQTGDMSHNIILQPDDVVYVPANPFASVGLAFQQVLFPARGITDTVKVPGQVDGEYQYWKNRNKSQNLNVHQSGGVSGLGVIGALGGL